MELSAEVLIQETQVLPDKLYSIDFSKREIENLQCLRRFSQLRTINLSINRISKIPDDFLDKVKRIREINFACNHIGTLKGLLCHSLLVLNVSYNRISSLEGTEHLKVCFI